MCEDIKAKIEKYLEKAEPWFKNLETVDSDDNDSAIDKEKIEHFEEMALSYYRDSLHFFEKGEYLNSLAALEYAEGWLDAGKSLGIFRIKNG